jgi:hypothetical protein
VDLEHGEPWKRGCLGAIPQQTCYTKMLAWKKQGLLDEALRILAMEPALEEEVEKDDA